jgi:hypothetical protein
MPIITPTLPSTKHHKHDFLYLTAGSSKRPSARHKKRPVVPSVVVGTLPMAFEPDLVTFENVKSTYFFEILTDDQKFGALKKVLEGVLGNLNYGRFKIVIVATAKSTQLLETQLRQSFNQLPVKRSGSESQFQHGVLLYELSDDLQESK